MAFETATLNTSKETEKPITEIKAERPKPCCVCLDQKQARDECMLISEDGRKQCADLITEYKNCMKGYGFNV
ncbi:cytochrome C oxidase copper chaperone-domain-containing protein [Kockiozyma suomiensis]|uniref:cytochrome C oxidase copper chaperone-domain-containing protein n=1 Tax=Kockiozyma suomiensis TaxID=1337062 RepID=UPI003343F7B4